MQDVAAMSRAPGSRSVAAAAAAAAAKDVDPDYDYEEGWNRDLECPVCLLPVLDPVTHACGILLCRRHTLTGKMLKCPMCMEPTEGPWQQVSLKVVLKQLGLVRVMCKTCGQPVPRADICTHTLACPVPCPNACGANVAPREMQDHAAQCPRAPVSCPVSVACGWRGPRDESEAHARGCQFAAAAPVARLLATMPPQRVVLRGLNLAGVDMSRAVLWAADISAADLSNARLELCLLSHADLSGSCLRGACLRGAVLKGADLRNADLRGADLRGAKMRGAEFDGANIDGALFDGGSMPSSLVWRAPGVHRGLQADAVLRGWTQHYREPYSHVTTRASIDPGRGEWLLVAAARADSPGVLALAACGRRVELLAAGSGARSNGATWYCVEGKAFGFSESERLSLGSADTENGTGDRRLSWHLDGRNGGWRAGEATGLNNDTQWLKLVFWS
eukprot:m51a1_g4816 hypothetical protein (447) ;mRNA; r:147144-148690